MKRNHQNNKKSVMTIIGAGLLLSGTLAGYLGFTIDVTKTSEADYVQTGVIHRQTASGVTGAETTGQAGIKPENQDSLLKDLPNSLRGTDLDGGFLLDDLGHLVVDKSVKRLFDYLLGTVGERSLEELQVSLQGLIESNLPEPARSEALSVLNNYLSYKQAVSDLQQESGQINSLNPSVDQLGTLEDRLARLHELRQNYLGQQVADAFYLEQEAVDQYTLGKLKVMNNAGLSASEKSSQLGDLERLLPAQVRESRQQVMKSEQLEDRLSLLRQEGASQEDIFLARAEVLGTEQASKFAELDQKREDFQNRLLAYRNERHHLIAANLSPADETLAVARLREQYFNPVEVKKVIVMDRHGLN